MQNKKQKIVRLLALAVVIVTTVLFSFTIRAAGTEKRVVNALIFDNQGQLVSNGTYNVRLALYTIDRVREDSYPSNTDEEERIWEITKQLEVNDGKLKIELNIPNVKYNKYYLGVRINKDNEMVPRKAVVLGEGAFKNQQSLKENNKTTKALQQAKNTQLINESFNNQETVNQTLIESVNQLQTGTNPGDIPVLNTDGKIGRALLDIPTPAGSGGVSEVVLNMDTDTLIDQIITDLSSNDVFINNTISSFTSNTPSDGEIPVYKDSVNKYYSTVLELELLKDINFSSLDDEDILIYDGSNNEWVNKPRADYSTVYTAGTGINLTGDIINLADTAVTTGTYGDTTHVAQLTVDQQGRITGISNVVITDSDTTYTAGTGLALSGANVFSLNSGIDNLTDVDTTTTAPTNGQVLSWDNANSVWVPATVAGGGDFSDGGELGTADRTLGNTDNFDLGFLTNGLNRLHIQNDGKIGIGTTAPSEKLTIFGTDNGLRLAYDALNYANLASNSSGELVVNTAPATDSALVIGSGLAQDLSVQFDGGLHRFFTGINNTSGNYVIGSGSTVTQVATVTGPGTVTNSAAGTTVTGTGTKFTATFRVGNQITIGADTVTITAIASDTSMTTDAVTTANTNISYTYNAGTKVVVEPSGNLGIGIADPLYALDVRTTGTSAIVARFNNASTNTSCTLSTNGGTINCSSDRRLKKNFAPLTDGLDTVLSLKPTTYNWKAESDETLKTMGFIAQEVEEILPGLVITDESSGYLQLSTVGMIPIITKAIQEQQLQIEQNTEDIITINANILKTDQNISTIGELQTSVDENLAVINQTLTQLDDSQAELEESVTSNTENLASLSESINSLTDLTTTLTDTITNHETRIAQLEVILTEGGIDIEDLTNNENPQTPALENIPESLETLAANLTVIQEEDTDEDGNIITKQIFSISGDLIVERLKARKIEAEEIKVIGVVTEKIAIYNNKLGTTVGEGIIVKDTKDVFVATNAARNNSQIFVTPKGNVISQTMSVSSIDSESGFHVTVPNKVEEDITFSWFIIEDKTTSVAGEPLDE